jgi:hypothetical protein
MKKIIIFTLLSVILVCSFGLAQEAWETHTRGLLHQSVFNTGALGVQYNSFRSAYSGDSLRKTFEWPGNSYFKYENKDYWYYNSCGAGLMMVCDTVKNGRKGEYLIYDTVLSAKGIDMIGCLGAGGGGTYRDGTGTFYWPGTVSKVLNTPLNTDGSWKSIGTSIPTQYNPNEAEEIITSSVYTPYGIKITRVSRAWSYPGYDSFIIYDYMFENTGEHYKYGAAAGPDTLTDIAISWVQSFLPSYAYANMVNGDFTTISRKELSRFDLKRWMQYVHTPDGRPHTSQYANWSANGTYGGGLMAPAAVGYMMLYFDYAHLSDSLGTGFNYCVKPAVREQFYVYDSNKKFKQPWVIASSQANLTAIKCSTHVRGTTTSRYNVWSPDNTAVGTGGDALMKQYLTPQDSTYWYGRARPNNNYNYASPMVHSYAMGPYQLLPNDNFHVVVAEVAGFGPGRKGDAKYFDYGGGIEETIGDQINDNFHPVSSWDSVITFTNAPVAISSTGGAGINYTPVYGLPAYIRDTSVVSIRDVADRCIQLYTGNTNVIKYDTSQYEPWGNTASTRYAPSPANVTSRTRGWNSAFKMPLPAPVLTGIVDSATISGLKWKASVDSLPSAMRPYVNSAAAYYQVLRSTSALGPWYTLDSVGIKDSRFWRPSTSEYFYVDGKARIGTNYFYVVVPVDSLGKKSGFSNLMKQQANMPPYAKLSKVYAVPNPFCFVSGFGGENIHSTGIQFYGMTEDVTIRVFSFSGQLVKTLYSSVENTGTPTQGVSWDLRSESGKKIASGVYYFTVVDNKTGAKAWNKFVVIH